MGKNIADEHVKDVVSKKVDLGDRTKYIGGSDAAACMNMSRWRSKLDVYVEKTGMLPPEDISEKLAVWLGNELEEVVAKRFEKETGKKVRRVNRASTNKDLPDYILCHIDRDVVGEDAILECKTADSSKAKEWQADEVPTEYVIQCLHNLMVTGAAYCYIACLLGNRKFVWKRIDRDEELIAQIKKAEIDLWEKHVVPKVMPMEFCEFDDETLKKLFPHAVKDKTVIIDDESVEMKIESIKEIDAQIKALEKEQAILKAEIIALFKDAERIETPNGYSASLKEQAGSTYSVTRKPGRVLRTSIPKEEK